MSLALGKNNVNQKQPLHLDGSNHLLVNDSVNKAVLETIATNTANINVNVGDVEINVADLEALQATTNTTLASILVDTDACDSSLNTIEAQSVLTASRLNNIQNKISANTDGTGDTLGQINSNILTKNGEIETSMNSLISANHTDLVALEASLTSMEAKQDTMIGHNDGVETILTAIDGRVDGLEGLQGTANTHLSEIEGAVETLEACVGSNKVNVNISSGSITGFATETTLGNAEAHLGTIDTNISNAEAHLGNIDTGVDVLEACVGSNKVNVNIASNAVDFATQTTLAAAEAHLGNIETAVQLLDDAIHAEDAAHSSGQKGIPCLMVRQDSHSDLAADGDYMIPTINANGEIRVTSTAASGGSTEAKQDDIIGHVNGIEGLLTTIDADTDAIKTAVEILDNAISGNEMQVDIVTSALPSGASTLAKQDTIIGHVDGIETLLGTIDSDTNDIKTAVQLIDNGYGTMTEETLLNASVSGSGGVSTSSVFTKPREIENIGFSITGSGHSSYEAVIQYSVDNSTYFDDTNLNFASNQTCKGTITSIGRGFKYYKVKITNNGVTQTQVVKISY